MDQVTLQELKIFTENDSDIYRGTTTPIVRNLRTKQAQGTYNRSKAVDAFMYLAEAGARAYSRENGDGEHAWHVLFPIDVRRAAATAWRDEFEAESRLGNYDNATYLPKKYLAKISDKKSPKKTRITTPHPEAYYKGLQEGRKYAGQGGVSMEDLSALLSSTRSQRAGVLSTNQDTGEVAEFLGLPRNASRTKIMRAYQEFDNGFERGATSVFDAMEGN